MRLMGTEVGRAEVGRGHEGSASPPGSANTNPPPSPSLCDMGDDDATPRQQWSPIHTVGGRARPTHHRGCHGGSSGGGTFAAAGERRAYSGRSNGPGDKAWGGANAVTSTGKCCGKGNTALHQRPRVRSPDSPVLRVDLERLDLSVLALGEESGPAIPASERLAATVGRNGEAVHPGTLWSEPGGSRPRSLGGRPSRVHALFVAPGKLGTGPASPPSSYSTHSESGFASPTARLASPSGLGGGKHHHHHQKGRVKKGHWKKGKPIGVGSCGNVYLGMNEDTGELMAVKEITLETKDRLLTSLYNEIQVMHKLVHPHIVGYLGAELQDSKRKLCIFQEWVPAGSLHSLLDQFGALSDAMTRKYTRQVLEGLIYLHANRVIHRDVKSKNILVDDRGNVKLADFGCALVLKDDNGDGVEMSMKGTPLFMAPEMLLKRKCGKRVDVWSLGCAVLEMVTTRPPWADTFKHPVEIIEHFSTNPGPPPLPGDLSPSLRDFLLACFTWDAANRPTSHQLGGHEYLLRGEQPSGNSSGSGDENDIPLEAMGRAPFVTRMRRCSSATLPELLQRSHGFGSTADLAAFGTAPSGTLRPPSPRYAPGNLAAAHNKRTPTRRRMYTEPSTSGMPPLETGGSIFGAKPAAATAGAGFHSQPGGAPNRYSLVRRASMPGRSPSVSPDKPRRPGRGSSPGRSSSAVVVLQHSQREDEGKLGSGPVGHARLRSMGDGIGGVSSHGAAGNGAMGRGVTRSESGGRTDSESISRSSSSGAGVPAVAAGAGTAEGHVVRKAAPTPTLPPIVGELLGSIEHGVLIGAGIVHSGDTPPPTVRPLGRWMSGQTGHAACAPAAGPNPLSMQVALQQQIKAAGGGGVACAKAGGIWGVLESRNGGEVVSRRVAAEQGE